jgi:hypothetical protein
MNAIINRLYYAEAVILESRRDEESGGEGVKKSEISPPSRCFASLQHDTLFSSFMVTLISGMDDCFGGG